MIDLNAYTLKKKKPMKILFIYNKTTTNYSI